MQPHILYVAGHAAAAGPSFPAGRNLLGVSSSGHDVTGLEVTPDAGLKMAPRPGLQQAEGLAEGPTVETIVTPQLEPSHESDPEGEAHVVLCTKAAESMVRLNLTDCPG